MPRVARIVIPDCPHHVTERGGKGRGSPVFRLLPVGRPGERQRKQVTVPYLTCPLFDPYLIPYLIVPYLIPI